MCFASTHQHCAENNLLPDYQSAYRPGYSCKTAISKIVSDLLWSMEEQSIAAMVFLDLSTAFDTVDHGVLHEVLNKTFHIKGKALQWMDSYSSPRWCQAAIGNSYSDRKSLSFSVPQGSCMGPTLYTLYASTLQTVIPPSVNIHGYADDHALKEKFDPRTPGAEELVLLDISGTMDEVEHWMRVNRLKLNPTKTECLYFGSKQMLKHCVHNHMMIAASPIPRGKVTKYLGVLLDQHLLFHQVTKACHTASLNLSRIRHLRPYLTEETCAILVKTLVMSHLDYCNVVYTGLPDKELNKLQCVQNIAAKLVLKAGRRDSTTECLHSLHWLPIRWRIIYKIALLVHKSLTGEAPGHLKDMFQLWAQKGRHNDPGDRLLIVPFTGRKTFADRALTVAGPKIWNFMLSKTLRNITTEQTFKDQLKTFLFAKAFDL